MRAETLATSPSQNVLLGALTSSPPKAGLKGDVRPPGDKSISHRALLLNALGVGHATITGLLEGEDVLRTAAALNAMGAHIERCAEGVWTVDGVGIQGLSEPENVLDMGNSGTAARLLAGALTALDGIACMTGDGSLRGRPMQRVIGPLEAMGARFMARSGGRMPLVIHGAKSLMPLDYSSPVASAQVKSAILLAGLAAPGETRIVEPAISRDHTERMLVRMGANVSSDAVGTGWGVCLQGQPELAAIDVDVPADPSSAAFPLVAALITPGSDVQLRNICLNPARAGLITTLQEMGGDIVLENVRDAGGEPVADLRVRGSALKGISVPPERAPSMIDEYPILSIAAAVAEGETQMRGIHELRVKETDRIAAMANGLKAAGVHVAADEDSMTVSGGRKIPGGVMVATELDHRVAMSFLVLSLVSDGPVIVDDAAPVATSFPTFINLMQGLGVAFERPER